MDSSVPGHTLASVPVSCATGHQRLLRARIASPSGAALARVELPENTQNYDDPTWVAKLRAVTARSSARRWRFASGFLFFGALTVVAGYYVPARREARKLRVEQAGLQRDLAAARFELGQALANASAAAKPAAAAALGSATADADRAEASAKAAAPAPANDLATRVRPRIDRLEARLHERFSDPSRAETLSISSAGDRVSVAIAIAQLFPAGNLEVAESGRTLLCQLAQTIMAEFNGQLRITGYYGKPRIVEPELRRRYATPWELSAARAARAVDVLVRQCQAPAERFLVVGYGPRAAGPLGENVAFEFIFTEAD